MRPLVSVIVVTLDDESGLTETLCSLRPLVRMAGEEVEVIVADGGSCYPVGDVVNRNLPEAVIDQAVDGGVYQGMNRGLSRSQGEFVWFLNGGDSCATDWVSLREVLIGERGAMVMNDHIVLYPDGTRNARRSRPAWYLLHSLPTSHQAILYPGDAARAFPYDASYDVAGDYAFTAELKSQGVEMVRGHIVVSIFRPGGVSTTRIREVARQVHRAQREILGAPIWVRGPSQLLFSLTRRRARWRFGRHREMAADYS